MSTLAVAQSLLFQGWHCMHDLLFMRPTTQKKRRRARGTIEAARSSGEELLANVPFVGCWFARCRCRRRVVVAANAATQ
jgi:hypothetical protein